MDLGPRIDLITFFTADLDPGIFFSLSISFRERAFFSIFANFLENNAWIWIFKTLGIFRRLVEGNSGCSGV